MSRVEEQSLFIDIGYSQCFKHGEAICGDAFKFQKGSDGSRVVAVLSDGLGSGVKANILGSMTASMALKFAAENSDDILHIAEIMMGALPICQVRKISYATFTIVTAGLRGQTKVIEMGNPAFLLFRGGEPTEIEHKELASPKWFDRKMKVYNFAAQPQDRLIFFSDGISQAGMGTRSWPLGWREKGCAEYLRQLLSERPDLSSHELGEEVLREARRKEPEYLSRDDMTCASLYFRHPRRMLLFTGPPYDARMDAECAQMVANFEGDKVLSGGTTAEIVARELKRELVLNLKDISPEMPPSAKMAGIELVTEGIFTLSKVAQYLENFDGRPHSNPAGRLVEIMLRNDIIEVLLGTRINEAHQDPRLPQDLELRRNVVKRIAHTLENNFLKKVNVKYV